MNRRDALKGGFLALLTSPSHAAQSDATELPGIKIAIDLNKGQTWHAFKRWCQADKRFYFELRDDPNRPLTVIERLDQVVPESGVIALRAHGYHIKLINPDIEKQDGKL